MTVLVGETGLILDIATSKQIGVPDGVELIEGVGYTLLPGLIDAHTHTMGRESLRQAAVFGVTTELDMFADPNWVAGAREREQAGKSPDLADLRSAGVLATAPGGHGTEYGVDIPTISSPGEAEAFVAARVAEGADYIKIVYDDGAALGLEFPTIDADTLKALIDAAHAQRRLAIVHIGSQEGAIAALEAGADGLAHIFFDTPPSPELLAAATRREGGPAFVTDTLAVCHALRGPELGAALAADARLRPLLAPVELRTLSAAAQVTDATRSRLHCEHAAAAVKALHEAGAPVLASTDVPNGGMLHGLSLHGELELLVQAGLSPTDALAAATSRPAKAFGLADRGRIAPGLRADLLLVEGDPTRDITATRDIVAVYKQGRAIDRAAYQVKIMQLHAAAKRQRNAPPPPGAGPGLISDFDDGALTTAFGAGWQPSTDALRGGASTVELTVSRKGARSKHALDITGTIDAGLGALAWAGAMFSPGPKPMQPANLSGRTHVSFWARGDAGAIVVMAFATQLGPVPARVEVPLEGGGSQWKRYTVSFEQLGIEPYDLLGLYFGAPAKPGPFTLRIDDVRLEPAVEETAPASAPE
ncbi:MAG: amidohydrolase family protein [Myxococcales bacterium]|nr:amidohydrolase family protein [Myxococcales bacterium]